MSADAHTNTRPLYRTPAEVVLLAQAVAAPAALQLFLSALRARHALEASIPVPVKPISLI